MIPRGLQSTRARIVLAAALTAVFLQAGNAAAKDSQQRPMAPHRFSEGDAVRIVVYPDTNFLNGVYPIDSKGEIILPMVGRVQVTDKTDTQLLEYLRSRYAEYLRYPLIAVKPMVRLSFLGGFARPGLYYVDPRATFWHAVSLAGGTEREDGIKKMRWERDRTTVSRDLVALYQSDKGIYEMGFQSGDQIWVTSRPKRHFWDVFRNDVIPVVGIAMSVVATAVTVNATLED